MRRAVALTIAVLVSVILVASSWAEETSGTATATEKKEAISLLQTGAPEMPSLSMVRVVQGLGICIGVFIIGIYLSNRLRGGPGRIQKRSLRIIERLSIAPKHSVVLLEVEGSKMLLAISPERTELIRELHDERSNMLSFAQFQESTLNDLPRASAG